MTLRPFEPEASSRSDSPAEGWQHACARSSITSPITSPERSASRAPRRILPLAPWPSPLAGTTPGPTAQIIRPSWSRSAMLAAPHRVGRRRTSMTRARSQAPDFRYKSSRERASESSAA